MKAGSARLKPSFSVGNKLVGSLKPFQEYLQLGSSLSHSQKGLVSKNWYESSRKLEKP